jgi:hypothetical protein
MDMRSYPHYRMPTLAFLFILLRPTFLFNAPKGGEFSRRLLALKPSPA